MKKFAKKEKYKIKKKIIYNNTIHFLFYNTHKQYAQNLISLCTAR